MYTPSVTAASTGQFADKWHLDEMVVTIKGKKHWLWRAVDAEGYVLDALVQSRRNRKAALRLLRNCQLRAVVVRATFVHSLGDCGIHGLSPIA